MQNSDFIHIIIGESGKEIRTSVTREQFENGGKRQIARIELDAYVMFSDWEWENPEHHYWQSPNERSLILYKEWVKGENNANL